MLQLNITSFTAKSFTQADDEEEAFVNYSLSYRALLFVNSDSNALLDSSGQVHAAHFFPPGSTLSKTEAVSEAVRQSGKRVFDAVMSRLSEALKTTR